MKRLFLYFFGLTAGKKGFQKIYQLLFRLSLTGMNYSNGGDFKASGELNVLNYIKEKLKGKKDLVLFDVGANVGNYSKVLSQVFSGKAVIHSFEPSKKTFERLVQTTGDISSIKANNIGLGETVSTSLLYTDNEASGLASVYQRKLGHHGVSLGQSEEVAISTIDHYCSENKIQRIHFLKMDIEGHELSALKGAAKMLANNNIDFIQFEFGGCNIDSRTYFKDYFFLLQANYRIFRILKNGLYEIKQYDESLEIFNTINFLAERKNLSVE